MPTTFLHLPVELRRMIKDWVDPADLRTHVCFYLTHPGCSALYDNTTENANYIELFEPVRISEDYREEGGRAKFTIHPALYHVDFRAAGEHHYHYPPHPVESDAHFRWQRNGETKNETPVDVQKRAYLGLHPLAARSFATASPIFNMTLFSAFYTGDATALNFDRPVTVYDVLSAIHQGLDTNLSVHDVHSYLGYGSAHAQCVAHAKWGVEDAFANLQSTRQVLTLCPIKKIRVEELTEDGAATFISLY